MDEAWAGRALSIDRAPKSCSWSRSIRAASARYFLNGTNHQTVVNGRAPRHRGVLMGRVRGVTDEAVMMEPSEAHGIAR